MEIPWSTTSRHPPGAHELIMASRFQLTTSWHSSAFLVARCGSGSKSGDLLGPWECHRAPSRSKGSSEHCRPGPTAMLYPTLPAPSRTAR
jgi:hypothetical protein